MAGEPSVPTEDGGSAAVLSGTNVTVTFAGTVALDDVTFEVPTGQVIGLIGPNGAGKSTLLGVLSGLVTPRRGAVRLRGESIAGLSADERARAGLARTFQVPALIRGLTVQEHLVLAMRMSRGRPHLIADLLNRGRRSPTPPEAADIDAILAQLGLASVADQSPTELPLGLQRLVEVAQSVVMKPVVLLLDEPSAGLDRAETEAFRHVLMSLRDRHAMSIVLVEHDLEFVLRAADSITVLDFGTVIARGTPAEIRADANVIKSYVGAGPHHEQ